MTAGLSASYLSARAKAAALGAVMATVFALGSVLASTLPASAQGAAAAPSPAAVLLAKQIVEVKDIKGVFDPIIRGVVIKARDVFMQTNFMWSKDLNDIATQLTKEFQPRVNELVDNTARIYASHFSEAELKDLLTFYQSPIGKKAMVEEPNILDEAMVNAGNWTDTLSTDVIARYRDEMKKRGHDM